MIHLTPEQEIRINAMVGAGLYSSAEQAISAALSAIETVPGFDGDIETLKRLLAEGIRSSKMDEESFWSGVDRETNSLLNLSSKEKPRA